MIYSRQVACYFARKRRRSRMIFPVRIFHHVGFGMQATITLV